MTWVICFTLAAYLLANSPLLYSLFAVHKPAGVARLWGYAPNQFFFMVVVFPFATFATLTSLSMLVTRVAPILPDDYGRKWFYLNWAGAIMAPLALAAGVAFVVYVFSSMSLDKLQPQYADRAVSALDKALEGSGSDSPASPSPVRAEGQTVDSWLGSLNDGDYLRVVIERKEQLKLNLLNPTIHALNMLQMLVGITVGLLAMLVVAMSADAMRSIGASADAPELKAAAAAAFWAIVFFSAYPVCYRLFRDAIVGGTGLRRATVMQDIIVLLLVVGMMMLLRLADPANRVVSPQAIAGYVPVALVAGGYLSDLWKPEVVNGLIGNEANPGSQIIVAMVVIVAATIVSASLWVRPT